MKAEESYEIETHDDLGGASGLPGQRPPPSSRGKVIFGLALLLIVAGAIVYRGISTRVRAAADVKADTRDLAVPAVSLAQPKRGAPQEEIVPVA